MNALVLGLLLKFFRDGQLVVDGNRFLTIGTFVLMLLDYAHECTLSNVLLDPLKEIVAVYLVYAVVFQVGDYGF